VAHPDWQDRMVTAGAACTSSASTISQSSMKRPLNRASRPRQRKKSSSSQTVRDRILCVIRQIPSGKVCTYGGVAKLAGFPRHARHVVATLRSSFGLPWHRVLGAGGEIKLRGDNAIEQRLRLQAEGVVFRGRRVDMTRHEFSIESRRRKRTPRGGVTRPKPKSQAGRTV
jgi:methylated-DNA-protein-cysteine methyltransferase-like protein